jgi:hypothetical protein
MPKKYVNAQRNKHIVILKLMENSFSRYNIYEEGSTWYKDVEFIELLTFYFLAFSCGGMGG